MPNDEDHPITTFHHILAVCNDDQTYAVGRLLTGYVRTDLGKRLDKTQDEMIAAGEDRTGED